MLGSARRPSVLAVILRPEYRDMTPRELLDVIYKNAHSERGTSWYMDIKLNFQRSQNSADYAITKARWAAKSTNTTT